VNQARGWNKAARPSCALLSPGPREDGASGWIPHDVRIATSNRAPARVLSVWWWRWRMHNSLQPPTPFPGTASPNPPTWVAGITGWWGETKTRHPMDAHG
jgi:hypothetical protein